MRVFEQTGNRDNKLRARMKWVVDELGFEELQRRIFASRKFLIAAPRGPVASPPRSPSAATRRRAAAAPRSPRSGRASPCSCVAPPRSSAGPSPTSCAASPRAPCRHSRWSRLGDVTAEQFRGIAAISRDFDAEVRITNRQNFVFRGLTDDQLPSLHERLEAIDMAEPGAELRRDVVACPGADTCNLAVTQSRGLARAIGDALEAGRPGEVEGVRTNISGCTNSCGQHHIADIGFFGAERRAHGRVRSRVPDAARRLRRRGADRVRAEAPCACRPRPLPRPSCGSSVGTRPSASSARPSRAGWSASVAPRGRPTGSKDLDEFPTPEENPDFYVDFGETGPYEKSLGESECAV